MGGCPLCNKTGARKWTQSGGFCSKHQKQCAKGHELETMLKTADCPGCKRKAKREEQKEAEEKRKQKEKQAAEKEATKSEKEGGFAANKGKPGQGNKH